MLVNLTAQALTIKTGPAIPADRRYKRVSFSGSPVAQVSPPAQRRRRQAAGPPPAVPDAAAGPAAPPLR